MGTLRLFNPQNDLALAAGLAAYTPPASAAAFARAGAFLPAWWSDEGDMIITSESDREPEASWLRDEYGLRFDISCRGDADAVDPWGWSANAKAIMSRAGAPDCLLPSAESIDSMRMLSHRRTAMRLREALDTDCGAEVTDESEIREFIHRHDGQVFTKSPWSCSGRGVVPLHSMHINKAIDIVMGMVRRQGSALLERATAAGTDFAALFDSKPSGVRFAGWSVFDSSSGGVYNGNIVASQSHLESLIAGMTDMEHLRDVINRLERAMTEMVAPHYTGPLGVDMLAGNDGTLNPCIELNLRRTMGFVARDVVNRLHEEGRLVMNAGERDLHLCRRHGAFCIGISRASV